ncbi:MAG TPA: hypothetical protein VF713_17595 [Thermoanaerobaculia bacterium]
MFRRVAGLFSVIVLAGSISFALPNGCNNYYCIDDGYGGMHCWQALDGGGLGDLAGCTTVRLYNGDGSGTEYCRATFCYYV